MALTPWNRQEEWYQQMINASTGNYLPSISAQDAGKVMTVESDGSWGVENVPSELPAVTDVDEGKVLTVNNSGVWVAQTPSSGGGVLVVHEVASGDDTVLDKNYNEITAAMLNGGAYIVGGDENSGAAFYPSGWRIYNGEYSVFLADDTEYKSSSATGVLTKSWEK